MSTQSQPPRASATRLIFQKTPNNDRGSSPHASSDGYRTLNRSHLSLCIANNIGRQQTCNVDVMIKAFLTKVTIDVNEDINELFDVCLRTVIPLCSKYDKELKEYCQASIESKGYAPFVRFANAALKDLKKIENKVHTANGRRSLKPNSHLDIMFCRNAELHIMTPYDDGLFSELIPDIFISSLASICRVHGMPTGSWDDMTTQIEDQPPDDCGGFNWSDALSTLEFKKVKHFKYNPPDANGRSTALKTVIHPIGNVMYKPSKRSKEGGKKSYQLPTSVKSAAHHSSRKVGTGTPGVQAPSPSSLADPRLAHASSVHGPLSDTVPSGTFALQAGQVVEDPPPLVQCAIYGAEKLASGTAVSHAINLMIFDQVVWIWWYDHEGAIQSSGIDLEDDLPRFLVLLIAFQRFTLEDWGFIPELHPRAQYVHSSVNRKLDVNKFSVDYGRGVKVEVKPNEPLYKRHTLVGRGSRVIPAECRSTVNGQSLAGIPLVAKFSWVDSTRVAEDVLLQRALNRGAGNKALTDHMPRIYASRTFGYSTATIREMLQISRRTRRVTRDGKETKVPVSGFRVLRSLVCEKLEAIDTLQGAEFLKVFFEIERCHYEAWNVGIHHNDPSLANFMYRTVGDEKFGVPNDWDLATDAHGENLHNGLERTGTVPFMAVDLLHRGAWLGNVPHLYRHDLEAIIWILVWVVVCYDNGVPNIPSEMRHWLTGDHTTVYEKKLAFYDDPSLLGPSPSWQAVWPLIIALTRELDRERYERRTGLRSLEETDPAEVARLHWDIIESSKLEGHLKEVILASKPLF